MTSVFERLGKNVEFEGKLIMEKNGFEVLGVGGVSGDGVWVGGVGKFLRITGWSDYN